MYLLTVRSGFSGAHSLRGYEGRCEQLHGHNWKVELTLQGTDLDETGMLMDFKKIKALVQRALSDLDHAHLNELEFFRDRNPTAENIARYLHEFVSAELPAGVTVHRVTAWETEDCGATYFAHPE
jgi:6-pyruvoyltetrahydropterin/6-carboxytetrahydropterin synthase